MFNKKQCFFEKKAHYKTDRLGNQQKFIFSQGQSSRFITKLTWAN